MNSATWASNVRLVCPGVVMAAAVTAGLMVVIVDVGAAVVIRVVVTARVVVTPTADVTVVSLLLPASMYTGMRPRTTARTHTIKMHTMMPINEAAMGDKPRRVVCSKSPFST